MPTTPPPRGPRLTMAQRFNAAIAAARVHDLSAIERLLLLYVAGKDGADYGCKATAATLRAELGIRNRETASRARAKLVDLNLCILTRAYRGVPVLWINDDALRARVQENRQSENSRVQENRQSENSRVQENRHPWVQENRHPEQNFRTLGGAAAPPPLDLGPEDMRAHEAGAAAGAGAALFAPQENEDANAATPTLLDGIDITLIPAEQRQHPWFPNWRRAAADMEHRRNPASVAKHWESYRNAHASSTRRPRTKPDILIKQGHDPACRAWPLTRIDATIAASQPPGAQPLCIVCRREPVAEAGQQCDDCRALVLAKLGGHPGIHQKRRKAGSTKENPA